MGIIGKILGNASVSEIANPNFDKLLLDDEEILRVYKFIRDEIIITNKGFYHTDVQGVGVRVLTKFYPIKSLQYISIETKGIIDVGFDISIGVTGNVETENNHSVFKAINIQVSNKHYGDGIDLFKVVKALII